MTKKFAIRTKGFITVADIIEKKYADDNVTINRNNINNFSSLNMKMDFFMKMLYNREADIVDKQEFFRFVFDNKFMEYLWVSIQTIKLSYPT